MNCAKSRCLHNIARGDAYSNFRTFENALVDFISFRQIGATRSARGFADDMSEVKNSIFTRGGEAEDVD